MNTHMKPELGINFSGQSSGGSQNPPGSSTATPFTYYHSSESLQIEAQGTSVVDRTTLVRSRKCLDIVALAQAHHTGVPTIPGVGKVLRGLRKRKTSEIREKLAKFGRYLAMERDTITRMKGSCYRELERNSMIFRMRHNIAVAELKQLVHNCQSIDKVFHSADLLRKFRCEVALAIEPFPLPSLNVFNSDFLVVEGLQYFTDNFQLTDDITWDNIPIAPRRTELDPHSGNEKITRREQWSKRQQSIKLEKERQQRVVAKDRVLEQLLAKEVPFGHLRPDAVRDHIRKKKATPFRESKSLRPHSDDIETVKEAFDFEKFRKTLGALSESTRTFIDDKVLKSIEELSLLVVNLYQCTTVVHALSTVLAFVSSKCEGSVLAAITKYITELFMSDLDPHAGDEVDWLALFRSGLTNWTLFSRHVAFKKISYLCSCLITLGLCEQTKMTWSVKGIKIFAPAILEKHVTAFDLIDAAVQTFMFFVEAGNACFRTGSFTPLLFSDEHAREFESKYLKCQECIQYLKTGNLMEHASLTEEGLDLLLSETLHSATQLRDACTNPFDKSMFTPRIAKLVMMQAELRQRNLNGNLRMAPFAALFYGASGVGKSSLASMSMVALLMSNGFEASDSFILTMNEIDKYMSNYKSHVTGVFIDDINNTKAEFVERTTASRIIELINNMSMYAVKADVDEKGKVAVKPRIVVGTTNDKSLGANQQSNEPVSIARRFNLTVTVSVRPEFQADSMGEMLDSDKVAARYFNPETGESVVPPIADLWLLRVEKVVPIQPISIGAKASIGYEVCQHNGKMLDNCSIFEFLAYAIELSRKHFTNQQELVERSKDLQGKLSLCPKCKIITDVCACGFEPHSGYMVGLVAGHVARKTITSCWSEFAKNWTQEMTFYDKWIARKLVNVSRELHDSWFLRWTNWIPNSWLVSAWGRKAVLAASRRELVSDIKRRSSLGLLGMATCGLVGKVSKKPLLGLCGAAVIGSYTVVQMRTAKEELFREIVERNESVPVIFSDIRERAMKVILAALGSFAVLYTLGQIYQGLMASRDPEKCEEPLNRDINGVMFKTGFPFTEDPFPNVRYPKYPWSVLPEQVAAEPHGNLAPCCEKEIQQKDAEVNPWVGQTMPNELPHVHKQRTIAAEDLRNLAFKNLCFMRVEEDGKSRSCDAFFVCSNVAIIPFHMWYPDHTLGAPPIASMRVEFTHSQSTKALNGHKFSAFLGLEHSSHIPGTDLCLVWVPNGGEWADLREYLPVGAYRSGPALSIYRTPTGGRYSDTAIVDTLRLVGHSGAEFPGSYVTYSKPTFVGMCMAPMISQSKNMCIIGFHLGGKAGTTTGCIGTVTQSQVRAAFLMLTQHPEVIATHSTGEMELEEYEVPVLSTTAIHKNCPLNYLDAHCNVKAFGSTAVRSTPVSSVVPTTISPIVEKYCGVPRKHDRPNFYPRWRPWFESLSHSGFPSIGVPPDLLTRAVQDYLVAIVPILKTPGALKYARRLSKMETLCGIDGVRFIDAIPLSTSAGFPFAGAKRQFVEVLPPTEQHQCPLILDERFWIRAQQCIERYLRGERCYPIFKACLKDEPTKIGKDKVRVFQAAPLHFGLLIRMYYLPIVRMLSLHPLRSECAVGINCQGPEWKQLVDHVTYFGRDRILAGDYGKYDLRMPAQLILAAFGVLVRIAELTGRYSSDDLLVMRGIAFDVAYAMTAYDGTLLQFIGSNPSGQNLTVYINSIVNSLLFRAAYFSLVDGPHDFQSNCHLITYGDDAMSSVHERCPQFNHLSVAKFMAEHDMEFTMPDKLSTPTEYMSFDKVDFLKRRDVFHPMLNISFGALDEESIFKSLHCVLRSKAISMQEQCSANMEGALREWFFHGEEVYEKRRLQIEEVAREAQIAVRDLELTYDERAAQWCHSYNWDPPTDGPGRS